MSKNTFENIYNSVKGLEVGSSVTFNGFPMVVESQTTTLNRYYGELRWVNQLDGKLDIDVTLRVSINFYSDYAALAAEVERLRKAGDAMCDNIPRMVTCQVTAHEAVELREAWLAAKGVQS